MKNTERTPGKFERDGLPTAVLDEWLAARASRDWTPAKGRGPKTSPRGMLS